MNKKLYYLNPSIKKIGLAEEYSKEQVEEYIKCSQDLLYFTEKYIKIRHVDRGLIPLKLRDYQRDLLLHFNDNRNTILLSARQSAKTTTTVAYILWYIFFNSDKTVAILANKGPVAREILARLILAYENIPYFLQPGCKTLNKGKLELGNGSTVVAEATTANGIRSYSCSLIYLDEFAFVPNADEFFRSTFPVISSGEKTKLIISSTPNGLNLFFKLWKDAKDNKSNIKPFEITWNQVPGRDEEWKKAQIEILTEHGFRQEYGNEFLGSANTLIAGYKLQELPWETPIHSDSQYSILEEPITFNEELRQKEHIYIALVDPSKGVNSDYSTITVVDITEYPYRTVAIFRDNVTTPIKLPGIILALAKKYNNAYVLCERNSMGQAIVDSLFYDYDYENIFSTHHQGRKGQILSLGGSSKYSLGVEMSKAVKRVGTATLKAMIEANKITHFSEEQVLELYNFVSKGDSFEADAGKHDDLVMNLVLFAWAVSQPYFKELLEQDISKAFNDDFDDNKSLDDYDVMPFGNISTGLEKDFWEF